MISDVAMEIFKSGELFNSAQTSRAATRYIEHLLRTIE